MRIDAPVGIGAATDRAAADRAATGGAAAHHASTDRAAPGHAATGHAAKDGAFAGAADWTIGITRRTPGADLDDVLWTGDVRGSGGVWGRFGRRGDERIVLLERVAELRASPSRRTAVLVHARGPAWDVPALRRVAPYLASLLGRTALHAAAVAFDAGVVLLCADTGVGKSTLSVMLDRSGTVVLGDDHVVLDVGGDGAVRAFPSFPFIDVDPSALRGLESFPAGKGSVPLSMPRPTGSLPVVAVAFLERGPLVGGALSEDRGARVEERGVRVERVAVPVSEALPRLLRDFVFVADPADDAAMTTRLDDCVRLLTAAPPVRLTIPSGLGRLPDTAAAVASLWSTR